MSISEAKAIVRAALPNIPAKQLKADAATYLNWFNGHAEAMPYSDPTGEQAVRSILATA